MSSAQDRSDRRAEPMSASARGDRFPSSAPDVLRILFVCVENSNRSQMAEAFARIRALELEREHAATRIEAYSAGSRPSGKVNPTAIESMRELGYDLSTHASKSLDDLPDVPFDAAITMGCGDACPNVRARLREDWNVPDPRDMPPAEFRAVRDSIRSKVDELLATLIARTSTERRSSQ
jgi:arsenate reductase (thioredoxin)